MYFLLLNNNNPQFKSIINAYFITISNLYTINYYKLQLLTGVFDWESNLNLLLSWQKLNSTVHSSLRMEFKVFNEI